MKRILNTHLLTCCLVALVATGWVGCSVEPPLHLYRGVDIDFPELPEVQMDVDVLWQYPFDIDWQVEWQYGWDDTDRRIFGQEIGYTPPSQFELRRYYLGDRPGASHAQVESFHMDDTTFTAHFDFGYYDLLLWNDIVGEGGVQSLIINESDPDNVTAETNPSTSRMLARSIVHDRVAETSYYDPEDLFSLYVRDIHISTDTADYDYYDAQRHVYCKRLNGVLQPISYIYLPQLILYHNNGRISGVDGNAVLTGMARRTSVNTGITESEAVNVFFHDRIKRDIVLTDGQHAGETVDIIGGRLHTFGLCDTNPYALSRAYATDNEPHYIGFNVLFFNGTDSTLVFDVSDVVRRRYRGGVITMELDLDSVPIPSLPSGGSGFDAKVADYDEETFEIDM